MGFIAPWFLAGLAAVGLPVYFHLLKRHKTTPLPFASLMFFERRTQSSVKHRRLRYLLLFAARALQGVAVGLISGPATAALVEIDPLRDQARPALLAGLAQAVGSGLGPLLSGCLAQWAPGPLHTPYLVGLAGTALAAGFVWTLPDGVRSDEPWRIQWPRVPRALRTDFVRLGVTAGIVWASLALYLSVVPSYVLVTSPALTVSKALPITLLVLSA